MGAPSANFGPFDDASEFSFDYDTYRTFLSEVRDQGYTFGRYGGDIDPDTVLLRHDVDWSPERAERMARIEADAGVTATYLFLLTSPLYNLLNREVRERLDVIQSLGHDVGLHFSTHQYWSSEPDETTLEERVADERAILESVLDETVDTVSFHIPPNWILNRSFDSFLSTYEERFFTSVAYFGDSNQRWRDDPPLQSDRPDRVQILVHPGLWGETDATFEQRLTDVRQRQFEQVTDELQRQFIDDALSE